jgi:hypothetical protein
LFIRRYAPLPATPAAADTSGHYADIDVFFSDASFAMPLAAPATTPG